MSSPGYVPDGDNGARNFLVRCQRSSHPQMNTSHPNLYPSYTLCQSVFSRILDDSYTQAAADHFLPCSSTKNDQGMFSVW